MKRHSSAVVVLTVVIHASCSSLSAQPARPATGSDSPKTNTTVPLEERPSILFAIADDWGYPHASVYGEPVVQTPAFDRIAREGVLFNHAFVSSPSCTASRGAILTGQHFWNLKSAANLWSVFPDEFTTYPEKLKERGYYTGHEGKAWGPGKTETAGRELAGTRYSNFAEFLKNCPDNTPFCYWLGSSDPHRPYKRGSGRESGMDLSKINVPPWFPDSEVVRGDMADYFVEVQRFDALVGRALKSLDDAGRLDNTIIVMTSDHGMPFPRCKSNLYDSGVRVPLAVRFGNGFPGGRKIEDLVSLIELSDLFLEVAGVIEPLPQKDRAEKNRELITLLRSDRAGWIQERKYQQVVFGKERHVPAQEAPNMGGYPSRGLRTPDYLIIENYEPDRWPNGTPNHEQAAIPGAWYADTDNGPTKSYIIANRDRDHRHRKAFEAAFAKRAKQELFDLRKDPNQLSNVDLEAYNGAMRQIYKRRLHTLLKWHDDPRHQEQPETSFDNVPYPGGAPKFDQEIAKWKRTDPAPKVDLSEFTPKINVFLWEPRAVEGLTEMDGDPFGEGRNAPKYYRYLRPGLELQGADVARLVKSRSRGSDRTHFEVHPTAAARKRLADSIQHPGMHTRMATVIANGREMSYMRLYVVNPASRVSSICRADSFIFSFWVGSAEEADAVEATFKPPEAIEKAQTLSLHAQSTAAVCFSRNGLLATTSLDRTVKLWDVKQRQLVATLDGFPKSPEGTWDRDAVFSPDGSLLAHAATGKAIQVYQTETKRQLWRSDNGARSLAFAPNGETLVTADWEDAAIKVWDARSGELLKTLQGTSATLKPDCWSQATVAYAPDGKTFATAVGGADMTAKFPTQLTIWDAESLTPRTQFVPQKYRVHAMAYSPDGKTLAIGGVGGTLRLVRLTGPTDRDAAAKVAATLRSHRGTIMGIAWSPDGMLLASCSREYRKGRGRIVVWRTADMKHSAFEWNGPGVTSVQFSPDGKSMASSGQDGVVTLWQVNPVSASIAAAVPKATVEPKQDAPKEEVGPQAMLIATLALPKSNARYSGARAVAVSPDGRTVISALYGSQSQIWDVEQEQARAAPNDHAGDVGSVGFSRDGRIAYAADWSALKLFNALTGESTGQINHELREDTVIGPTVGPGGLILTRDEMTSMRVWDLATRRPMTESLDGNRELRACRFSPDGRWVVGETGRRVLVWNVETGKLVGPFRHAGYGAAISRDGKLLAISTGEQMEIRDLATGGRMGKDLVHPTGAPSESLPGLVGTVPAIFADFGADNVLVTRDKNDAWFWFDVGSDAPRSHKLPMGGRMKAVRFLGDGRRAATVSQNAIAVWQVGVAEPIWRKTFENGSWRTEFTASSDGQWLLIHTRDKESIVYSAATGAVVAKETGAMDAHVDGEFFVTGRRETIKVWRLPMPNTQE